MFVCSGETGSDYENNNMSSMRGDEELTAQFDTCLSLGASGRGVAVMMPGGLGRGGAMLNGGSVPVGRGGRGRAWIHSQAAAAAAAAGDFVPKVGKMAAAAADNSESSENEVRS